MERSKSNFKEVVFVSFSKPLTKKVANALFDTISEVFITKQDTLEIFLSDKSILPGDNFHELIDEKMSAAKCGISILSPENINNSPWLMYEAGILSVKTTEKKGRYLPLLFCRNNDELDSPLTQLHACSYVKDDPKNNIQQMRSLFIGINDCLALHNQISPNELVNDFNSIWRSSLEANLKDIAIQMNNPATSSYDNHKSQSDNNQMISLSPLGNMVTAQQDTFSLEKNFNPATPSDIEDKLAEVVRLQLNNQWLAEQNPMEEKLDEHRVIINNTRISSFIAFTDGNRLILFDRVKNSQNTNVLNERLDVFGSVQFQNRTMRLKINNPEFMNLPIEKVREMPGFALEDNSLKGDKAIRETAIMIGICVFMSPRNISKAVNENNKASIKIYPVKDLFSVKEKLTSKAMLSVNYLINSGNH